MPLSLRCYTFALVAVAVATVALLPPSSLESISLLALCALVVLAERLSRVKIGVSGSTMSISLVVTVITVLVLSPSEAALVGMVTSMFTPRTATWNWTKQFFNTGMLSVVPAIAAAVCHLTGGHSGGQFLSFPAFLWPFAAAVTTCLVANGLIIAGYFTLADNARFFDVLRGDLKRAAMPYYSSAVLALIFLALWKDIGWYTAPLVVVPMYIAHWSLSQYAQEEAAHEGTIAALVQAVEIKDSYTRGHSERVARGAEMLARQLKMPAERVAMLRFAGLLHDIGKLGVPTRLLTSTGGLTEEEFQLLCMHPNHGVAVLRDIRFLTEVYEGVLYHHERLDGR
ncbi:MAG: HD domain-containing protein, partial [Catenulisporales bacterium]|nr:HD domain-containing protein [Catenulisporales bacterium]